MSTDDTVDTTAKKTCLRVTTLALAAALIFAAGSCRASVPSKPDKTAMGEFPKETLSEEDTETAYIPETAADETEESATQASQSEIKSAEADAICEKHGAVGVQLAVIRDGEVEGVYCFGLAEKETGRPVTEQTKFRVASLSKLATDAVFMALADAGVFSEEDDIGDILGTTVRNPYYPDERITPRMLMTHTSSVIDSGAILASRNAGSTVPINSLLARSDSYSRSRPGEAYSYCNFGVAVIGAACEKATGRFFSDLAAEYLFSKLGIDAAYVASELSEPDEIAALYGNGGYSVARQLSERFCAEPGQTHHLTQGNLTVSAGDYAEIPCMLLRGGVSRDGTRVLSETAVSHMLTDRFDPTGERNGYGLWFSDIVLPGCVAAVHTGSNFGMYSAFAFSPETRDGAVVLTSGADGTRDAATGVPDICLELIRLFYGGD